MPRNYRPIGILSVLYKLFAIVILNRIKPLIDKILPKEQAGFRKGWGCDDHLQALRLAAEKATEWGETVWACSLDVEKAFDTIDHEAVLDAICRSGAAAEFFSFLA